MVSMWSYLTAKKPEPPEASAIEPTPLGGPVADDFAGAEALAAVGFSALSETLSLDAGKLFETGAPTGRYTWVRVQDLARADHGATVTARGVFAPESRLAFRREALDWLAQGALRMKLTAFRGDAPVASAMLSERRGKLEEPPPLLLGVVGDAIGRIDVAVRHGEARLIVGDGVRVNIDATFAKSASLTLGDDVTCNDARLRAFDADVALERDAMLSDDVLIQANDNHALIDLDQRKVINGRRRQTVVERHVWIGSRATVAPGVRIGHGAVIGAGAVVAGDVAPRTAVAGNPARVVRENITWSRSFRSIDPEASAYIETA